MWAKQKKTLSSPKPQNGFTIVELLIVIIVIAILAALTVVAYNGIKNRSRDSAVQSDTSNAGKLIALSHGDNGKYPNDLSTVNNGGPLSTTGGNTYQYTTSNSNANYCLTVTNANVSYKISDANSKPTRGACSDHTVGGVAQITNLVANPRLATSSDGYSAPSPANNTTSWSGTEGPTGGGAYLVTTTEAGSLHMAFARTIPVQASQQYAFSFYLHSVVAISSANLSVTFNTSGGGSTSMGYTIYPSAGWNRYSVVATTPTTAVSIAIAQLTTGAVAAGGTYKMANTMITQSSTVHAYADGSSPNWSWNGTPDASTSYGPPL